MRDMENARRLQSEYQKKNYITVGIKIRKDSELLKAIEEHEEGPSLYIKNALIEKLRKDGYLPEA